MKISPEFIKRKNGQVVMKALHKLKGIAKLDKIVKYISETENTNPDTIRFQVKKILINGLQRGFLERDGGGYYFISGDNFMSTTKMPRIQKINECNRIPNMSRIVAIKPTSEIVKPTSEIIKPKSEIKLKKDITVKKKKQKCIEGTIKSPIRRKKSFA